MMYKCHKCIFFEDCIEYGDEVCEYEEEEEQEADNEDRGRHQEPNN